MASGGDTKDDVLWYATKDDGALSQNTDGGAYEANRSASKNPDGGLSETDTSDFLSSDGDACETDSSESQSSEEGPSLADCSLAYYKDKHGVKIKLSVFYLFRKGKSGVESLFDVGCRVPPTSWFCRIVLRDAVDDESTGCLRFKMRRKDWDPDPVDIHFDVVLWNVTTRTTIGSWDFVQEGVTRDQYFRLTCLDFLNSETESEIRRTMYKELCLTIKLKVSGCHVPTDMAS